MRKNKRIPIFFTYVLLLLFVIGNTPVRLLHNIFANHTDIIKGAVGAPNSQNLHQQTFHCQCDHQVVESAFIGIVYISSPGCALKYVSLASTLYAFTAKGWFGKSLLRGPPAA
ncbi:MAG: hypothetical protein H7211_10050 [Aquabacterium sp.]|nr:hypothetical protein [Ferruginibacter sp.]